MNQLPTKDWHRIVNMFTKQNIPLFDDEDQAPCLVPERGDAPGRAVICSIPKSGTYFFAGLLEALGFVSCGVHVADGCFVDCCFAPPETVRQHPDRVTFPLPSSFVLPLVRPGQFVVGHLPCSTDNPSQLRSFRVLFAYRNLRDAMVSYMRYVTKNWLAPSPANAWAQQPDGPEKMERFLAEHAYYLHMCAAIVKWKHRPEVLSCCFEDFMGDRGRAVQMERVETLVRFTGMAPCHDLESVLHRVIGQETLTSSGCRTDARTCWSDQVEHYFREQGGVEMERLAAAEHEHVDTAAARSRRQSGRDRPRPFRCRGSIRHRRRALRPRWGPLRQAHRASSRAPSGGHIMSDTAPQDTLPPAAPRTPHIYIAGLGLQTVTQITREVQDACRGSAEILYVDTGIATRTFLEMLCPHVTPLFDESYARDASRVSAYHHMAARVVEAALVHPPVTFALHGHPLVAALPPFLVLELAAALDLRVTILPGVSALDALLADLRLDPVVHGIQMYEATDVLLRRRPLQSDVPAILWQIGPIETCLPQVVERHGQAGRTRLLRREWFFIFCGAS